MCTEIGPWCPDPAKAPMPSHLPAPRCLQTPDPPPGHSVSTGLFPGSGNKFFLPIPELTWDALVSGCLQTPPAALISSIAAGKEGGRAELPREASQRWGTFPRPCTGAADAASLLALALLPSCNEKQNKVLHSTVYCKATKIHFHKKWKQQYVP